MTRQAGSVLGTATLAHYARPRELQEALDLLSADRWRVLAGGTDFYPAQGARPIRENILDINGLRELRHFVETDRHVVFGARTTWTDIMRRDLPTSFDALKLAAREVGSIQIQNAGTVAGNLCNASPAADGVPPLLALDAEVELRSLDGVRHVPLADFIQGNRKTSLAPDELMTAIRIPKASTGGRSSFVKLGARRYLVISIAMVAVRVEIGEGGLVENIAIAVGSCSAVARRMTTLEQALRGRSLAAIDITPNLMPELDPIDDVRGSAEYRRLAAAEIVYRAIAMATDPDARELAA